MGNPFDDEQRAVCLEHIEVAWQDMRPLSLVAATQAQGEPRFTA